MAESSKGEQKPLVLDICWRPLMEGSDLEKSATLSTSPLGSLTFEAAWNIKSVDEIFDLMDRVVKEHGDRERATELESISSMIKHLSCPTGQGFVDPIPWRNRSSAISSAIPSATSSAKSSAKSSARSSQPPSQNISREPTPNWDTVKTDRMQTRAKMTVVPENPDPQRDKGPGPLYFNPCDLLGLFLSRINLSPRGADALNFFLPWTACYGKWCMIILLLDKKGNSRRRTLPSVAQCTWRPQTHDEPCEFFLGVSASGFSKEKRAKTDSAEEERALLAKHKEHLGRWDVAVKAARYDQLYRGFLHAPGSDKLQERSEIKLEDLNKRNQEHVWDGKEGSFDYSPSIAGNGVAGIRFGNCAETYPFINLLFPPLAPLKSISGSGSSDNTNKGACQPPQGPVNLEGCQGLALRQEAFSLKASRKTVEGSKDSKEEKGYDQTFAVKNLMDPCDNCKELLRWGGCKDIPGGFGNNRFGSRAGMKQCDKESAQVDSPGANAIGDHHRRQKRKDSGISLEP